MFIQSVYFRIHRTPVVNIAKGVTTNEGGHLSHALIIAHEFGIPRVVGTQMHSTWREYELTVIYAEFAF